MNSIQFQSSFHPLFSHPQHNKYQFNTRKFLSHSTSSVSKLAQRTPYIKSRAAIITNSLILAETVPVKGGDLSVLLPTGGLLLLVYFIANFVIPSFVIKDLESDKETDD